MKTISKLFMAVVAGMLAFSCVTDTTDDLGVNLGEGQSTTLTLSLEESRTHLGIKDEDGNEYPLFWSEGDKIAVNGEASDALGVEYHGQQQATFKFTGTLLNYPYNIVYPAPAEGVKAVTAGQQVVTFKTSQVYTEGSFAEGSVPMYGYVANENAATTLNHLAGVLRIAPYGNATLKVLVITAENGKLAGNFDVDTEGNLTAHADATNAVTVTFGEGLTLGATEADAKPIYVAVPAGDYGSVSVTLITDKDSMTMGFNTSGENENGEPKAIKAGKIREFAAFEYKANSDTTGDFFIYDEASLLNFAENAATTTSAKVVADIDMTGESWTAIDNYSGVFDGGNFKIKGLTAPLFGVTANAITIKNVHLTDVDITISKSFYAGAIALHINNAESIVENCSAEGKLSVAGELKDATSSTFFGGCFGRIEDATIISKITNKVDVTIAFSTVHTGTGYIYVGGCVGLGDWVKMEECHNDGDIQVTDASYYVICIGGVVSSIRASANHYKNLSNDGNITVNAKASTGNTFVSGITAQHYDSTLEGKYINTGDITVTGDNYALGIFISGVIGYPSSGTRILTITDAELSNSGTLTWSGTVTNSTVPNLHMGGIFTGSYGKFTGTAKSIVNTGDLICTGSIGAYAHIGGITTGRNTSAFNTNSAYDNLENAKCYCKIQAIDKGETCYIGMLSSVAYSSATAFKKSSVGGSVQTSADDEGKLTLNNYLQYLYRQGSTINESFIANIDNIGWLENDINSTPQYKEVAGIEIDSAEKLLQFAEDVKANPTLVDVVVITADIDMTNVEWTSIDGYAYTFNGNGYEISGLKAPLFKTASGNIKNVKLTNVAITDNSSEDVAALVCSYSGVEIVNCSVSGTITSTRSDANNSHIAGVVGHITSTANFSVEGCVNNCAINVTLSGSATNKTSYIGGVVGRTDDVADSVVATIKNCYNNAPVSVTGATTSALRIGGVVSSIGYVDTVVENCHNIAKIALGSQSALFSTSQTLRMGGVIGDLYRATSGKVGYTFSGKDCSNSGSVDIYANVSNAAHIGGVIGTLCDDRTISPLVIDNFDNSGTVTINGEEHSNKLYVGGVIGWSVNNLTMSNCNNSTSGAVSINLETKTGDELAIGGLVGLNRVMYRGDGAIENITDCDNKASVSVNISESSNKMIHCGGCFGKWFAYTTHKYYTTFKNVDNYGTVQLNCNSQTGASLVGGIIGGSNQADNNKTTDTTCYLKLIDCDNIVDKADKNKIHITNGSYGEIHVAGIVSYIMANIELDNCNNSMELLFDAKKATTTNMFSGILTRLTPTIAGLTATIKNCKNSGDISMKASELVKGYAVYAGIFGYNAVDKIQTINITGCTNTGDIYVCDKQTDSALFCAGLCGVFRYGHTVNITDCTNEGSIDVRSHTADGLTGGLIGRTWDKTIILSLTNCHNKASATISHKANTTTDVAAFVGGLAGLLHGTISIKQCSNSADISVIGTATRAFTGGIIGGFRTATPLKLDNVSNSGNIHIGTEENSLSVGTINVGGLMGDDNSGSGDRTYTAPITNTGNIILTNATINTPESSYIGGAVGLLAANINNVKSLCNIQAVGYNGGLGMITGSARVADTVVASNCVVGGSICTSMTGKGEAERPNMIELSATNYFNYIYGSADWTGVDNYDGCTVEAMPTPEE